MKMAVVPGEFCTMLSFYCIFFYSLPLFIISTEKVLLSGFKESATNFSINGHFRPVSTLGKKSRPPQFAPQVPSLENDSQLNLRTLFFKCQQSHGCIIIIENRLFVETSNPRHHFHCFFKQKKKFSRDEYTNRLIWWLIHSHFSFVLKTYFSVG